MLIKLQSLIFILAFTFNVNAKVRPSKSFDITSPDKHDILSAKLLAEIIRKIDKNKYTNKTISRLQKSDRNKIFSIYNEQLNDLKKIKVKSSQSNILKVCGKYLNLHRGKSLKEKIHNKINNLCHRRILLSADSKRADSFNESIIKYFIDNSIQNSKRRTVLFNKFLEQLKETDEGVFQSTSKQIFTNFMSNEYKPRFLALASLPSNNEFTEYLQFSLSNNTDKNRLFTKELSRIYNQIGKNLKKPIKLKRLVKEYTQFYILNKDHISLKRTTRQLEHLTRKLVLHGYKNEAREFLDNFLKLTKSDTEYEHRLLFKQLWISLIKDDYKDAAKEVNRLGLVAKYAELNSRLKFWVAYILKNNNEEGTALSLYKEFLKDGKINYYTILAQKEIALLEDTKVKPNLEIDQTKTSYNFKKEEKSNIRRVLTWLEIDYFRYASLEMHDLIGRVQPQSHEAFLYKITNILNKNRHYLFTFKTIYRALNSNLITYNNKTVHRLFPTVFFKDIKKLSGELDPIVILSLIRQESAFNPNAKSRVGARGLMQLMPATARELSSKRLKTKSLKKPKVNLRLGIKYLSRLINKYDGSLIYSLSAYNAGEYRVKTWKRDIFKAKNELVNIETIPFEETQNYVKLIYRNIYFYKFLMKEDMKFDNLQDTFYVATR